MTSEDFKLFQESFFPRSWVAYKEGPDVGALLRLQGEEREKAEEMLLESLTHHHPWAPMGLGELRSQKASLPLKSLLNQARGETLVEVAMALWKIEEYPQSRDYIIAVLRADDPSLFDSLGVHAETLRDLEKLEEVLSEEGEAVSEEEVCNGEFEQEYEGEYSDESAAYDLWDDEISQGREAAAYALKHFKCKESMRALLEALNDRDCRVRERAARSLFDHLFILDPSFPGDFSLLYQIASDDEHKRSKGIKVVKEWIKEKGYL